MRRTNRTRAETYSSEEIVEAGHKFFGKTTRGLAKRSNMCSRARASRRPISSARKESGAIVGGLRYGEGTIYYKNGTRQKIYWRARRSASISAATARAHWFWSITPSTPREIYDKRFGGVEGSAYLVGGLGVNFQKNRDIILAPIRTGVGARLGANVGYLKYSTQPDLEPVLIRPGTLAFSHRTGTIDTLC